jgi:hypothetical protein
MTEQVRTTYRSHRRTTWVLMIAFAAVLAAVAIPFASGQSGKTFTLSVSPSATCASPASAVVTVKNTTSPQTLGSIEIYFPPNTVASVPAPANAELRSNTTSSAQSQNKDIVAINDFNVASGASKQVTVNFKAGVSFNTTITAVAKQSNRFSDSSGSANIFDISGGFPTLKIVTCVTVSGRVYQDRNLDNTFTTGQGAFLNSDVPKAWNVQLYGKDVGAATYALVQSAISASDGSYTFSQVPTGSDYKVCVTARGTDSSSKWGLQSPTGNTDCAAISSGGPLTAANRLPSLGANAVNQDFQVVPVVGPFGAGDSSTVSSTSGTYQVIGATNTGSKPDDFYVQDTWVDSQGQTNFRFSPVNVCTQNCPAGKIYLLEVLTADITLSSLGGKQVLLRYDDAPPFLDGDLKPMPYCSIDPRSNPTPPFTLATSGVLPGSDTSCIVEASQNVVAGGGSVHTVYKVYTSYDGGRQIGK